MAANRVFSGQCRIEAIAGDGQAVLLEGFRVHLDLRLEPETAVAAGSHSERTPDFTATERAAPRRPSMDLSATPAYQKWAVVAALGSLILALAIWWSGGAPAQPAAELGDTPASAPAEPEAAEPMAAAASVGPAKTAIAAPAPPVVVVPVLAAPLPPAAPPAPAAPARPAAAAAVGTARPPSAPPVVRTRPSGTSGGPKQPTLTAEHAGSAPNGSLTATRTPESQPRRAATARLTDAALIDLFGDTK